jgi:HEPN domain-containing protein
MKPNTQNWIDASDDDQDAAEHLFKKKMYLHCLFFCQQSIEKALKALYYEKYSKTSPRKHDLVALAEAAGIFAELDDVRRGLFVSLSQYYIESRYAEDRKELLKNCTQAVAEDFLKKTGEVLQWLKNKLK